jgi:hypothetical protein
MPLRDHFHSPFEDQLHWESFQSAWINTMVRHLNARWLPPRYRSEPQTRLGIFVEADVATFDREAVPAQTDGHGDSSAESATAVWAPPQPNRTATVSFPAQDVFEVLVYDERRGVQLVAAVELISPSNKDGPENRHAFVAKCASYLQQGVSVVLVDLVTDRRANLHAELMVWLDVTNPAPPLEDGSLYAAAYRTTKEKDRWRMDNWATGLVVGTSLPTMPLWLASKFSVPLELEATYEETCRVLRLD